MARAKKRARRKAAAKRKPARRRAQRAVAKRKPAAAPTAPRPVVIPGAWPFPMGPKPQ